MEGLLNYDFDLLGFRRLKDKYDRLWDTIDPEFQSFEDTLDLEYPSSGEIFESRRTSLQCPSSTQHFPSNPQFLDAIRHSLSCRGSNWFGHIGGAGSGFGGMGGRFHNHPSKPFSSFFDLGDGGDGFDDDGYGCGEWGCNCNCNYGTVPDSVYRRGGGRNGVGHCGCGGRGGRSGGRWWWNGLVGIFSVAACLGVCLLWNTASRPTCNIESIFNFSLLSNFNLFSNFGDQKLEAGGICDLIMKHIKPMWKLILAHLGVKTFPTNPKSKGILPGTFRTRR